eukprot:gnl/MRDRNA2_/MRDRNA2_68413_c0_seq1.p1 gnl/MRDRNA2_/MRDRNA2_68413_c0~~gnl/MRDRNA2_/MRDRNA2_68413_c0_seq1.p1  ORF type:complete len:520 (+),score=110.69 gnl/MRDRNA2_/MRDRNA2_68413_c0_seq1:93-1652(+)
MGNAPSTCGGDDVGLGEDALSCGPRPVDCGEESSHANLPSGLSKMPPPDFGDPPTISALWGLDMVTGPCGGRDLPHGIGRVALTCAVRWGSQEDTAHWYNHSELQLPAAKLSCLLLGNRGELVDEISSPCHGALENGVSFEQGPGTGEAKIHLSGLRDVHSDAVAVGFVLRNLPDGGGVDLREEETCAGRANALRCQCQLVVRSTNQVLCSVQSICPINGAVLLAALVRRPARFSHGIRGTESWRFEPGYSCTAIEDGLRRLLVAGQASSNSSSVSGRCERSRCGTAGCFLGARPFGEETDDEPSAAAPEALVLREEAVVNFVRSRMREDDECPKRSQSPNHQTPFGSPQKTENDGGSFLGELRADDPAERIAAEPFGGYLAHQLIEPKVPNMPAFVVPRISLQNKASSPVVDQNSAAGVRRMPAKQPEKPAQEAPEEDGFEDFDFDDVGNDSANPADANDSSMQNAAHAKTDSDVSPMQSAAHAKADSPSASKPCTEDYADSRQPSVSEISLEVAPAG